MAKYAVPFSQSAVSASYKTAGLVTAAAAAASGVEIRRGKLYDLLIGQSGTPADNVLTWDVSRQTAAGTATSVTPNPLDPADAASCALAASNATAEGTVTANSSVLNFPINQRASYRWVAAPGSELLYPATAANGFAVRVLSPAYTGAAGGEFLYDEQ